MSASSYTDWQISCDHPGCGKAVWASEIDLRDLTATGLRGVLKRRGWTVNVPGDPGHRIDSRRRLDFCPDHKPDAKP